MEELIERVRKLDKNKAFQEHSEKNQLINKKLFKVKKSIITYFLNNKLENDNDYSKVKRCN